MAYVHILRCADDTLYVGSTIHLSLRLEQHQAGLGSAYTKRRLPVELIWSEDFSRVDEAFAWEKRIQGWSHAKRMAFIEGGLEPCQAHGFHRRRAGCRQELECPDTRGRATVRRVKDAFRLNSLNERIPTGR